MKNEADKVALRQARALERIADAMEMLLVGSEPMVQPKPQVMVDGRALQLPKNDDLTELTDPRVVDEEDVQPLGDDG